MTRHRALLGCAAVATTVVLGFPSLTAMASDTPDVIIKDLTVTDMDTVDCGVLYNADGSAREVRHFEVVARNAESGVEVGRAPLSLPGFEEPQMDENSCTWRVIVDVEYAEDYRVTFEDDDELSDYDFGPWSRNDLLASGELVPAGLDNEPTDDEFLGDGSPALSPPPDVQTVQPPSQPQPPTAVDQYCEVTSTGPYSELEECYVLYSDGSTQLVSWEQRQK
jgi:hypothetical protein